MGTCVNEFNFPKSVLFNSKYGGYTSQKFKLTPDGTAVIGDGYMYVGHGCCDNKKFPTQFEYFMPDHQMKFGECQKKVYAKGFVGAVIAGNQEPGCIGVLQMIITWIPGVKWLANKIDTTLRMPTTEMSTVSSWIQLRGPSVWQQSESATAT